jgi:hypothetical protein
MKKSLLSVIALLSVSILFAQGIKFGAKAGINFSTVKFEGPPIVISGNENITEKRDSKFTVGFNVGGLLEIGITDKFSFQPELLFSAQGTKLVLDKDVIRPTPEETGVTKFIIKDIIETTIKNNYLNVPLLAKYYATKKIFIIAGPQLGFLLSSISESSGSSTITGFLAGNSQTMVFFENPMKIDSKVKFEVKNFKSFNFSLGLGGGYFFTENIFAEARYNLGLSNDAKPEELDIFGEKIRIEPIFKASSIQFSLGYRF